MVCQVMASEDITYNWDFFVSYTSADQPWAEWIAWVLEEDGHRVLIQAWDFVPGSNWIRGMQTGTRDAARTVAVLSDAYLNSVFGSTEWQAALASDPDGSGRKLLVARVEDCQRTGLLAAVVSVDLFDVPETAAKSRLQEMIRAAARGRAKPTVPPRFPGEARAVPKEPGFPGNDRNDARGRPQDYAKDSEPSRDGNWFQRLRTPIQAAIITGIFTVLAAAVTGIFALINSHGSPPSPGPDSPTASITGSSPTPSVSGTGNLVSLSSRGVEHSRIQL